jgi:hypothetical protein
MGWVRKRQGVEYPTNAGPLLYVGDDDGSGSWHGELADDPWGSAGSSSFRFPEDYDPWGA